MEKKPSNIPAFFMNLTGCARCEGHHPNLPVFALNNPPDDYKFFSTCPSTKQPILVKRIYSDEPENVG